MLTLDDVIDNIYKRHAKAERFDAHARRMTVIPDIGDGGFFEYFAFLVSKYGQVPKGAMGETISSENTVILCVLSGSWKTAGRRRSPFL